MQPLWELLCNNMRRTHAARADCACFANRVATHLAIDNSRFQGTKSTQRSKVWLTPKTSNFGGQMKDRPPHLDRRSLGTVGSSKQHASTGKMSVTARPQEQKSLRTTHRCVFLTWTIPAAAPASDCLAVLTYPKMPGR